MKIRTKIAKLQMHETLHKNVNENMFSFTFYANCHEILRGQLKRQMLCTDNFLYAF